MQRKWWLRNGRLAVTFKETESYDGDRVYFPRMISVRSSLAIL